MLDPHRVAESVLGPVQWETPTGGYCRCPGEGLHTQPTGPRDCRVRIDGAPTAFCFHSSCTDAVSQANSKLRRELAQQPWRLTLPGGRVLRAGESLTPPVPRRGHRRGCTRPEVVEAVYREAEAARDALLEDFAWPYEEILSDSPTQVAHRDPHEQFRLWLRIWPPDAIVWCGDVFHSGKPEHASHFRPVPDWYQIGPAMGNFTCACSFQPGSFRRADHEVHQRRFLVVESDTLSRDEVGAVFRWLCQRMAFRLHCIVDTAGKSLHAWFDPPQTPGIHQHLKVALTALGCDPKLFTRTQPVRVPGAFRDGNLQKLIWLRKL